MATTLVPNHEAQMLPMSLTVTPGVDSYRIAFDGPGHFEEVCHYRTATRAFADMREAIGATEALLAKVFA